MRDFEIEHMRGCEIIDQHGDKVGTLRDVLNSEGTATPEWAVVQYGLPRRTTLLPIAYVYAKAGGGLASTVDRDVVRHAPRVGKRSPVTAPCKQYYQPNA